MAGLWVALPAVAALAAMALFAQLSARKAERLYPPQGRLIAVRGIRLHMIDTGGSGPVVVLLHGSGATVADMEISGLIARAARRYRVVAFDRPGFGYSARPRTTIWTPAAQADLFHEALKSMGIEQAIVVGHSWGTMVALALALDHPQRVTGLVLLAGYYFPIPRSEVPLLATPAVPFVGDIVCYTVAPLIVRAMIDRIVRNLFSPQRVPPRFTAEFPFGLAVRPLQLRAFAEESALLIPCAAASEKRYGELRAPVVILAGARDPRSNLELQSVRLHQLIAHSHLKVLPGLGHMLHHFAADEAIKAIDMMSDRDLVAKSRQSGRFGVTPSSAPVPPDATTANGGV